jgi:hypothetical protein
MPRGASSASSWSDEQWVLIGPFLPKLTRRKDGRGRPWRENRAVLNGMLWILDRRPVGGLAGPLSLVPDLSSAVPAVGAVWVRSRE